MKIVYSAMPFIKPLIVIYIQIPLNKTPYNSCLRARYWVAFDSKSDLCLWHHFVYNEDEIEFTDQYKYVGIIFSTNKNMFHKSREYLANQARKAIYAIKNMSSDTLGDLPPVLKFKIIWFPDSSHTWIWQ